MVPAKEIVYRNKGDIKDLLHHLDQEIHVNSLLLLKADKSIKCIYEQKGIQLLSIKTELQMALINYNETNNKK